MIGFMSDGCLSILFWLNYMFLSFQFIPCIFSFVVLSEMFDVLYLLYPSPGTFWGGAYDYFLFFPCEGLSWC